MAPYTLTDATIEILKNFANINSQVLFKAGNAQRTCNPSRNFIADVELPQALPVECALFELNRLLGIIDTCKGTSLPSIAFGEHSLVVEHDHGAVTIPYAHKDVIMTPPQQQFHLANPIASFDMPLSLWTKMKRTASVLETTVMHIILNEQGELQVKLVNDKDTGDTAGSASYNMPNTKVQSAIKNTWAVKFDALTLIPGDYEIAIGEVGTSSSSTTLFGMFITLKDPNKKVTYLTSGHVVKSR